MTSIAVIGAGYCGVALCSQIRLRYPHAAITLYSRTPAMGSGVAYGTASSLHCLNVPCGRMGMDEGNELAFYQWLLARGESYHKSDFVPRSLYGQYLAQRLDALDNLSRVHATVVALQESANKTTLTLSCGSQVTHDYTCLTLGNFPSRVPQPLAALDWSHPALISDPWHPTAQATKLNAIGKDATVLLIGTGLTALDVASLLLQQGVVRLTAFSRRGLLPCPHRGMQAHPPRVAAVEKMLAIPRLPARFLYLRRLIRAHRKQGGDWRDVMVSVRPLTPQLWQSSTPTDQALFLSRLQPYWDAHRHRISPTLERAIQSAVAKGYLRFKKGSVIKGVMSGSMLEVSLRQSGTTTSERYTHVVNCTGPNANLTQEKDALVQQLLRAKMITADQHHIGLRVGAHYGILNQDNIESKKIAYLGPLLKADYYEATAVPELRMHTARMVETFFPPL